MFECSLGCLFICSNRNGGSVPLLISMKLSKELKGQNLCRCAIIKRYIINDSEALHLQYAGDFKLCVAPKFEGGSTILF